MWSNSQRCNILAHIACLWLVSDTYCFLWSIFAERNRSCSRVSLFSKQFTACLFVRMNIPRVDVSASRRSRTTRMQLSLFVVFLIWLRFLVDFRFADFRMIRISALPVFHISRFPGFQISLLRVNRYRELRVYFTMGKIVIEGQKITLEYSSPRCYWSMGDLTWRTCWVVCNLVPRVLSYPPYGARERDPGKRWSPVSQNLGDYKQTIWGRGR